MKRRLLCGLVGALILVTSLNPGLVTYAESNTLFEELDEKDPEKDKDVEENKDVEEEKDSEEKKTSEEEKTKEPEETKEEKKDSDDEGILKEEKKEDEKTALAMLLGESKAVVRNAVLLNSTGNEGGEEHLPEKNSSSIIKKVSLYKTVNGSLVELSTDGSEKLGSGDVITVKYEFESPLKIVPDNQQYASFDYDVVAGHEYTIPGVPSYGTRTSSETFTVQNGGKTLGEATVSSGDTSKFVVDNGFTEPVEATDAYFQYNFQLNFDGVDNEDKEEFVLNFGGTTVPIKVTDYMPKSPDVEKSASEVDENGDITWTVTVTNNAKPIDYEGGYSFSDTFSSGQNYVEGSFKVNRSSEGVPEVSVSGNTISWNYKDNTAGKVTTFTYKTHVDLLALTMNTNANKMVSKTVSNKVVVSGSDETYGSFSKEVTANTNASKSVSEWIAKTGTDVDLESGESTWTVTVRNNGFNLNNVILYDQITTDATITIKDISVVDKNNYSVAYDFVRGENGAASQFKFGNMAGDAEYKVTYTTKIEKITNFLKTNHKLPENKAWISYEYHATGDGPAITVVGPAVNKPFTGIHSKAAVEKSATAIDVVNHTMTWLVVANKSAQPLTTVKITDTLPEGHEFVEIKDVKVGGSSFILASDKVTEGTDQDGNKTVTVDFGDALNNAAGEFYIVTKLDGTQNHVWAGNKTQKYRNTVTLTSTGNEPVSDSVEKEYSSTVLEKTAGTYDYSDRTIRYTITVNKNGMEMNNVTVKDTLESKLDLVAGSVRVSNATGFRDDTSGRDLQFHFDKITTPVTIEFTAKVVDGEHFNNTGTISLDNKASITSSEYGTVVETSPVKRSFTNKVLAKEGSTPGSDGKVNYTVRLNPAKQNLYTGNISAVKVKDTLGASFILDESSVKLYIGSVSSSGVISEGTEITGVSKTVSKQDGKTVLEVTIPREKDGNAFVLKYSADAADLSANDLTNNAQLVGYGGADKNNANANYVKSQFSNVSFNKYTYLVAELRDKLDDHVLQGGEFKLLDKTTKAVVGEKITGSNGQLTFVGKLENGKEYLLVETKAPEGYIIPDELSANKGVVVTAVGPGLTTAMNNKKIIQNEQPSRGGLGEGLGNSKGGSQSGTGTGEGGATGSAGGAKGSGSGSGSGSSDGGNSDSGAGNGSGDRSVRADSQNGDSKAEANLVTSDSQVKEISVGELAAGGRETVKGARLAKTGGFVGTVIGYLVGVLLVVAGILLITRKRKHV